MSLEQEIEQKTKMIHTDSYSLSLGEIISLYKEKEIDIEPEFQRYFRWTTEQRTKLIESIILGIPIPPIFVFQREDGVWDLIDGLQRLSTILEFVGVLIGADGKIKPAPCLNATEYLPSLKNKFWEKNGDDENSLTQAQRLLIKRAKIGV